MSCPSLDKSLRKLFENMKLLIPFWLRFESSTVDFYGFWMRRQARPQFPRARGWCDGEIILGKWAQYSGVSPPPRTDLCSPVMTRDTLPHTPHLLPAPTTNHIIWNIKYRSFSNLDTLSWRIIQLIICYTRYLLFYTIIYFLMRSCV